MLTLAGHESAQGQTKHTLPKVRRPLPKDEGEDRQIRREPNAQYCQYGFHECSFRLAPPLRDSFGHGKIPRLCGHHSLSSNPTSQRCERAGTRPASTGRCRPRQRAPERWPRCIAQEMLLRPRPSNSPCCAGKKDRLRCRKRPSPGRKRPRRAAIAGGGLGVATAYRI